MNVQKFEDLIIWQKSQNIAVNIYNLFKSTKEFAFRDQIFRAAISISNNIAQGFNRETNKEFIRFLYISRASCSEVKSMLYLSVKIGLITDEFAQKYILDCDEINRIGFSLIKKLKLIIEKG
jgi:four helix bundle protein